MKTKIQINSIWGNLLFEYEKEDNSIKETLIEAIKQGADLQGADLQGADLQGADLRRADLQGADLQGADLRRAYLQGAYLQGADLRRAYLQGAYLRGADLQGADLQKLKHTIWIIPEEGSFIAWKKLANNCLAKIEIPAKSLRTCNFLNRKCRAKYVKTLKIWDSEGKEIDEMQGMRSKDTIYKIGRLTYADGFDKDLTIDCSKGIHFFITKQEALDWNG